MALTTGYSGLSGCPDEKHERSFQSPTSTVKVVDQNHTAWVPYFEMPGVTQINFEQLRRPIDKDVSIRKAIGRLAMTLKVVGRTRVHSQFRLRAETGTEEVKETLWSTSSAANFPCTNDVTRVLSQLAEKFF
jgi:hypothetical protein